MKPATQAMAWRASTSELRKSTWPTVSRPAGPLTPGMTRPDGSGALTTATSQTVSSNATATASAPASHGPTMRHGRPFQRVSVPRVSRTPWTRTNSGAISLWVGARSRRLEAACAPLAVVAAQARHEPHRLERDPRRHLRPAVEPVAEADGDLTDAEAPAHGAVGQLDLERVAARADRRQVDLLQDLAPEALEAPGEVAHPEPQDAPRVPGAAAADDAPHEPPVLDAAAIDVPGAQRDVGVAAHALQQPGEVRRVVREVRVHLEHVAGAALERAREAREVRRAEPLAQPAVEDLDLLVLGRQAVGDAARAVRRVVVDDEDPVPLGRRVAEHGERRGDDRLDVLGLVVRGQDEPGGSGQAA